MKIKKIVIIPFLILFVLIGLLIIERKKESEKKETLLNTPQPTSHSPEATNIEVPKGFKINVEGIEVNNIYNFDPDINERGDVTFVKEAEYQLIYFSKENEFLISILGSPFEEVKKEAELDFLNKLEIDKEAACKLKVIVNTPRFVNPNESGKNYNLSFCE